MIQFTHLLTEPRTRMQLGLLSLRELARGQEEKRCLC